LFIPILFCLLEEKLKELEEKTGHSKVYFFVGALLTILSLIYVTGGMKLASDLVGFLYPAYMSFKALEGGKTVDGDATQWMTYWVIFSSMMLLESTFPVLARTVSFFHVVKIGIIIWLYHPQTSGAQVIYGSVVRPNIQKFIGAKKVE
jgi:receptor expression-enhancing protein 5/6